MDFLEWKCMNLINISLKIVPRGPIDNIPALVKIMVWRRPGDKPLSEPMMDSLPMHICISRPQWVNRLWPQKNISLDFLTEGICQPLWAVFCIICSYSSLLSSVHVNSITHYIWVRPYGIIDLWRVHLRGISQRVSNILVFIVSLIILPLKLRLHTQWLMN